MIDTAKSETASSHRKDSASFPKPILKRTVQGQSSISHSRKVRFPSPDIEAASAKRKTSRVGRRHNPQPFQWMAKRPRKKARVVDIDRLLEEEEGAEELWDDVEMIDNPEGRQHDKRKEIAEEPSIILQENPFAPQVRIINGVFVLENNSAARPSIVPERTMEIVEED
ncbi:unnamed protein product [Umbelopsis vinacea]